ncbi:MAG: amidoligase family protein, partial [Candidatus Woesearchaeota archaeon]
MLRRLNEIVSNTADFINEGLNKNEYKKITKNIHLGVELELIHIYGEKKARSVNYQEYEDSVIEYALYDWAIRDYIVYEDTSSIDEYNEFIDSFMNFLSYANRLYEFLDMKRFIHWDGASNLEDLEEIVIDENDDFNSFKQNCDKCFERDYDIIHEIIESFYINVINALKQKENESKFFWSSVFNNLIDFQNRDIDVELNDRVFSDSQELKEFCLEEFNEINKNFYKILESIEDSYKRIESDIFKSVESRIIDAAKNYANLNYQPLFSEEQEQFIDLISDATKKLLDKYGKIEPSSDYSTWQVTTDTSISPDGYELISPIIPYNEFLKFIPKLCQSLDRDGFYANETTGFHIGVSLEDQIGKDIYDGLFDLYESKYNKLVAMIMTTAQGYQSTFRHVPDRMFNKYCMNIVSKLEKYYNLRLSDFSLEDLLYSDKFDDKIQGGKYTDLNTLKENYVEIRVLGGEEGFEILKNEQRLKYYLYDAISQAYKGITFVQSKEVIKVMKNLQRTGKNKTVYGISDKNIKIEWNKDK